MINEKWKMKNFIMPRKATKKELTDTLRDIYKNDNGEKFDMHVKRIIRPKRRRILIGLIVFFGLISITSWLGIIFFNRFGGAASDNIKISIIGKEKVIAGEELEYEVKFKNSEDFPLASSEAGLYLPKSFILKSSEPLLNDKNSLRVGTMKVGEEASIKFKGKFFAPEGEKQILQAVLTYKPSNFNSNFEKVGNLEVEIIGSIFDGSLDGPDKISSGDAASYKLTYKNKSGEALEGVAIDAVYPAEFIAATSSPAINKNNRWELGKLDGGTEGAVELKGSFSSDAKGQKEMIFKLGIVDKDGALLSLVEKKAATDVVGSGLVMSITAGAQNFGNARWGEPINYSISYKNEGKETLFDVKLKINIAGIPKEQGKSIIDWASYRDANGGRILGETVVWTKDEVSSLAKIKPGDGKTIDFSVSVISKPESPSYRDYKIDATLAAEIERAGNVLVKRKLQMEKMTIFILSDAAFLSQARYYDESNNIVGSGPIPPKVGEKTMVRMYWKITNSMHDLENIIVSGELPEGVVFSSPASLAGTVALDSSLKKIVWSLNLLPSSVKSVLAQFDLSVTPTSADAGKILDLLKNIKFSAKDKSTGGTITIPAGDETTALPDDQYVTPGGKVTN